MSTVTAQARPQTAAKKRIIHQLDTPFSTVSWPEITPQDQENILEVLCNLLAPIGTHRQNHGKASKGKRQKRKTKSADNKEEMTSQAPPEPAVKPFVDVGFNCITQTLQTMSHSPKAADDALETPASRRYSMVFVSRGDQASAFNCHFPQVVAAASQSSPNARQTRLVGFSKACSERLALTLGLPRVSSIAILEDAPGSKPLHDLVLSTVPTIDVPWLSSTPAQPVYLNTKIVSTETTIGNKRVRTS